MSALPLAAPEVPEAFEPQGTGKLIPHITVHCFAEGEGVGQTFRSFAGDKRMRRASVEIVEGGIDAAITRYRVASSPTLVVIDCALATDDQMIWRLDQLADVCTGSTRVIVVGRINDISLYRKLIDYGISDYFVAPIEAGRLTDSVEKLFCDTDAPKLGNLYAFIGAKGGVGSSTIAQNTAWWLSESRQTDVLLADMDLPFGTAALGSNVEQSRGMADVLREIDRLDDALLERLMTARGKRLRLLTAPEALDTSARWSETGVETVLDVVQRNMPFVALDLPHAWTDWIKIVLKRADRVVVTATPTLPGMRNAVSLIDSIRHLRPDMSPPLLVLNQMGAPRRAEVSRKEIETTLEISPTSHINYNAKLFGAAESKGMMISEISGGRRVAKSFETLADHLTGKPGYKQPRLLGWLRGR